MELAYGRGYAGFAVANALTTTPTSAPPPTILTGNHLSRHFKQVASTTTSVTQTVRISRAIRWPLATNPKLTPTSNAAPELGLFVVSRDDLVEPFRDVGNQMRPARCAGEEVVAHLLVGTLVVGDRAGYGVVEVG